ncbi:hypothetical protein GCM10009557_56310 [Virgisporangium ochraceum]|uniref:Uncharacterized protein n=1 Tax=Virgisporangium ochraceum TaxID=65505 RepID=A0A8J3ZYT9_9ACTN|nr:hypothetical protein [Virgisporangium ochraceum]GIJ71010.1 hypothetical protein Voc01_059270 [Virgisporangium ochraceum]
MSTTHGNAEPELRFPFSDRRLLAVLVTLATALFTFATRLRLNEKPWGDEPHYLIMSIALSKYHTFDLTQAYENRDYWDFYPENIDKHVFRNADGAMVPLHNFGGPLVWALPFDWWGRAGAAAVIVLASVLNVINMYWLLRELGIVKAYAGVVTALFIVGTPLYMYSSMQFIEPLGALLVVFAVRVVLHPEPSWARVAVASAGLGYLPWIHGRFIVFTVILGVLLVARADHRSWRAYLPAVVPMAVLVLALELFNFISYDTLSPAPGNSAYGDGLFQIPPYTGLAGLLFDRQYGLLSHFPLLAVAVPGMVLAFRRRVLPSHVVILGTVVVYVLTVSTFKTWWAGWSPPGRLLVVLTPLFAYYVAVVLQRLHSWIAVTVAALAALGGFLVSVTGDYYTVARFATSAGVGKDPVLEGLTERLHLGNLTHLLPSVRETPDSGFYLLWYGEFLIFVAIVWLAGHFRPADRIPTRPASALFPVVGALRRRLRRSSSAESVVVTGVRAPPVPQSHGQHGGRRSTPPPPDTP